MLLIKEIIRTNTAFQSPDHLCADKVLLCPLINKTLCCTMSDAFISVQYRNNNSLGTGDPHPWVTKKMFANR